MAIIEYAEAKRHDTPRYGSRAPKPQFTHTNHHCCWMVSAYTSTIRLTDTNISLGLASTTTIRRASLFFIQNSWLARELISLGEEGPVISICIRPPVFHGFTDAAANSLKHERELETAIKRKGMFAKQRRSHG